MIILGLLLLIAAVIFGAELVFQNHHHLTSPAVFGQSLPLHNEAALFILGAITGAAILLGLALIMAGIRRQGAKAIHRRGKRKEARGAKNQRDELAADNESLRGELAQERAAGHPTPTVVERPVAVVEQDVERAGASRSPRL